MSPGRSLRRALSGRAALCAALIFAAFATVWVALGLLARVTPALFPGQALPVSAALPEPLEAIEIRPPAPESVFNDPIVILVAGIDERPGNRAGLEAVNTDTIMLVRIDPVANDTRVLSIPRDLLIDVTFEDGKTSPGRANMSFAIGAAGGGDVDDGMEHLERDLEREFDLEIDHWVLVDILAAERLIDELGGVDVGIPTELAIRDWWYSNDDEDHHRISLPAGYHHLDGYHAVAFARLRALDDDLHRIRRQQIVLQAAMEAALSGDSLSAPVSLWGAYKSTVRTNVPLARMPGYANLLKRAGGDFKTYSLAGEVHGAPAVEDRILRSGAAVLVGIPERINYWLEQFLGEDDVLAVGGQVSSPP